MVYIIYIALELCKKYNVGWCIFELIIHGLVYAYRTIRDPSAISAIYGFYRNRDIKTTIKPNPNKEGYAQIGVKMIEEALKQETNVFINKKSSTDNILEATEYCANLLLTSELVPMYEAPTAKIQTWRQMARKITMWKRSEPLLMN